MKILSTVIMTIVFLIPQICETIGLLGNIGTDEIRIVDRIELDDGIINVYFFDPTYLIIRQYPNHPDGIESLKSQQWMDFLYNNIVYVFALEENNERYSRLYIMRGNPFITQSARFYKLDILHPQYPIKVEKLIDGYDNEIVRTIDNISTRGILFEHMEIFQTLEGKQYVGQGIIFYGKYANVTTFDEIKKAILPLIEDDIRR